MRQDPFSVWFGVIKQSCQCSVCFNFAFPEKNLCEMCHAVVRSPCSAKPGLIFHSGVHWAGEVIIHVFMTIDLSA